MEPKCAIAELRWIVPDVEHEDWTKVTVRLGRPVRFEQDSALWTMSFFLPGAVFTEDKIMVPVQMLSPEADRWLVEDAVFSVWPTGKEAVAAGRIVFIISENDVTQLVKTKRKDC